MSPPDHLADVPVLRLLAPAASRLRRALAGPRVWPRTAHDEGFAGA
ncbi:hypothetical protein ABZ618_27220 [Streptomyces roseolus]